MTSTESIPKESSIEKQKAKRGKKKIYLVCCLVSKAKLVSRFSIRDLVVSEPIPNCSESALKLTIRLDPIDFARCDCNCTLEPHHTTSFYFG
jgi:hypothetical protein